MYGNRYPRKVAGVILVEASNQDNRSRIPGMLALWQGYSEDCRWDAAKATFGLLRFKHAPGSYYPETVKSLAEALSYTRRAAGDSCDEISSIAHQGPTEVATATSLDDLPLTVISAGKNIFGPPVPDFEAAGAAWQRIQAESTRLSSASTQVVAPNSTHYVQYDDPELVMHHVEIMVDHIRHRSQ